MGFEQTLLWRKAFVDPRHDAAAEEQAHFRARYLSMRKRAEVLVTRIATDLPHMTVHDVTHLDALWEMASLAIGDESLNPPEAFVFGAAVLLHDSAMSLAAYPQGLDQLKQTVEWQDAYARLQAEAEVDHSATRVEGVELERLATEDTIRLLHAKQAEALPFVQWTGPSGQPLYLLEDEQLREFYGKKIGSLAYSHWWNIDRVEAEFSTLGPLAGVTGNRVNLLHLAALLRLSDAMHLDQRRAPAFQFALLKPTGESGNHWLFQNRMSAPFLNTDAITFTAQPPFDPSVSDAWWVAHDSLRTLDKEAGEVDRLLKDHGLPPFTFRRVEGIEAPARLAKYIETTGWTPVDSAVRVSDVPKIVESLGGKKLYGDDPLAGLRELIQNALDAITARRKLEKRPPRWGELLVSLERKIDGHWLRLEDNGVGMSPRVLTGPLIDFGNSFWRSRLASDEFPGLPSSGMRARGRYGIGFFAVFMLGDHVRVTSRKYNADHSSVHSLEFRSGLGSRPLLLKVGSGTAPLDGGTRVEVKLRNDPYLEKGIMHVGEFKPWITSLPALVASLAPAIDVDIVTSENGVDEESVKAGDWLKISDPALKSRTYLAKSHEDTPLKYAMTELRDDDGRIFGRARIEPDSRNGRITVDGLAANSIEMIEGVLIGEETTAARHFARPIVPASVLASWASEQATLISGSDASYWQEMKAAQVVLACGGSLGSLAICEWLDTAMNVEAIADAVAHVDQLMVLVGDIEFDEDDDIKKSDFESSLEVDESIMRLPKVPYSLKYGGRSLWISQVLGTESFLHMIDVVRDILGRVWGRFSEETENGVVGKVAGAEVVREVSFFTRTYSDPDP